MHDKMKKSIEFMLQLLRRQTTLPFQHNHLVITSFDDVSVPEVSKLIAQLLYKSSPQDSANYSAEATCSCFSSNNCSSSKDLIHRCWVSFSLQNGPGAATTEETQPKLHEVSQLSTYSEFEHHLKSLGTSYPRLSTT